jgi:hypothetical protein
VYDRATVGGRVGFAQHVDVERVVIQSGDFPGTLPGDLAEMHAIIDSIQIKR